MMFVKSPLSFVKLLNSVLPGLKCHPLKSHFIEKLTTKTSSTFTQNIWSWFLYSGGKWKLILVCFIGLFVHKCAASYLFCNFSELLNPAVIEGERLIKRQNLKRSCSTGPSRVNLPCNITRTRLQLFRTLSSSAYTPSCPPFISPLVSVSLLSFVASPHREITQPDTLLNNTRHLVRQLRQSMRTSGAWRRRRRQSKRANVVVTVCACRTGLSLLIRLNLVYALLLFSWTF